MSFQNLENMSQLAIAQFVFVYDEILKEKSMSHGPATGMELKALMEEAIYQEKKTEIVEEPVVEVSEVDSEPVVRKGDIAPKDVIKAIKADFHYTQNVEEGEKPRVHRLNLPYLPGSIDYTQGCQAMCLNGGMCSPCMTRLPKDAESIFCKACEKKGGCESDRASFLSASSASKTITFGTYLAKRQVPTEFVKTWVQKHFGEKLIIPEEEWVVDTESVTMARKATTSKKSKKTKKTIETSSDEESVGESNAEPMEATNAEPVEVNNAEHSANVPEPVEATNAEPVEVNNAEHSANVPEPVEVNNAEEGTSDTESTTTNEDVSSDKKKKKSLTKEEKAAKKAERAAKKAEKEQEKEAKKAEKEAKKVAKEEEKAAKKAEKEAKKAAAKTEKKVAKESKKDTHATAKKGELGYMLPQKEEQEERVELHSEEEEEEDDYGIKRSFALNGKCYGVDEENTVYEMEGKQPVEIVGTWDTTTSYPIFNDKE
jgi:chemotaxis protein histidine kinase CheA